MLSPWFILSSVAVGTFMATLDSSIVNVALPTVNDAFHSTLLISRWIVIAYLLTITATLLAFGKLADLLGRKLIYILGFITFTLGSLFCGLSGSITQIILSRCLQGIGASMLMANGPAVITAAFPNHLRGRALGTMGMVVSTGLAIGPSLGGLLLRISSWQSIFLVNLPFGVLGILMAIKYIPSENSSPRTIRQGIRALKRFDLLGALLWAMFQLSLSFVIDQQHMFELLKSFDLSGLQVWSTAISLILMGSFFLREILCKEPVLNLRLFKSAPFFLSNISGFISILGISSVNFLMPYFLQTVRQMDPLSVGLTMTAIPLCIFLSSPISGRVSDSYGSKIPSLVGMVLILFGLFALSLRWQGLSLTMSSGQIVAHLILIGLGFGIFQSPNSKVCLSSVPQEYLGTASALLATLRNLGIVGGTALSSFLYILYTKNLNHSVPGADPWLHLLGLRRTFLWIGCLCTLGLITLLLTKEEKIAARRPRKIRRYSLEDA